MLFPREAQAKPVGEARATSGLCRAGSRAWDPGLVGSEGGALSPGTAGLAGVAGPPTTVSSFSGVGGGGWEQSATGRRSGNGTTQAAVYDPEGHHPCCDGRGARALPLPPPRPPRFPRWRGPLKDLVSWRRSGFLELHPAELPNLGSLLTVLNECIQAPPSPVCAPTVNTGLVCGVTPEGQPFNATCLLESLPFH